jgi:RNA polymerase sigma-70 factor (ECF subfamily)
VDTSASLLARLRRDVPDQAAWSEFVRRYGRRIELWCGKWDLQEADAQDLTQTVLAELAAKMRTFVYDPARSFRAYLKTLVRYAWCDFLEKRKRQQVGSGDSQVWELLQNAPARDDLERQLVEEFDRELLDQAVERVRQRVESHTWEAYRLTAVEGLSGAAVAQRLNLKVMTVFKAKSKVKGMLQAEIRDLERSLADQAQRSDGGPPI